MTTSIPINGIDLKKKIQAIEHLQFAKKGICMENGCYEGISFFIAFDNQNHLNIKIIKNPHLSVKLKWGLKASIPIDFIYNL